MIIIMLILLKYQQMLEVRTDEYFKIAGITIIGMFLMYLTIFLYLSPLYYLKIFHPDVFDRNRGLSAFLFLIYTLLIVYSIFGWFAAMVISAIVLFAVCITYILVYFGFEL